MVIYTENCLWLDRWLVSAERGQISIGELCGSSGSRWLDEMETLSRRCVELSGALSI